MGVENKNVDFVIKSNFISFCSGYYGRLLNQIRYNLSLLRFHLFTYNIIDNPMCPGCFDSNETTEHFIFDCVYCYTDCRDVIVINHYATLWWLIILLTTSPNFSRRK